jgi:hypothetical protein
LNVSGTDQAIQIISLREKIYTNILLCYDQAVPDEDSLIQAIERTISVVYGRNNRPAVYFAKVFGQNQAVVTVISSDGLSRTSRCVSLTALRDELGDTSSGPPQPTDYMLQRNILSEPTWLVNTIESCFEDLEGGEAFPERLQNEAELKQLLQQRSFHSPSLTDAEALWAIYFVFEELDLFAKLDINRGTVEYLLFC